MVKAKPKNTDLDFTVCRPSIYRTVVFYIILYQRSECLEKLLFMTDTYPNKTMILTHTSWKFYLD